MSKPETFTLTGAAAYIDAMKIVGVPLQDPTTGVELNQNARHAASSIKTGNAFTLDLLDGAPVGADTKNAYKQAMQGLGVAYMDYRTNLTGADYLASRMSDMENAAANAGVEASDAITHVISRVDNLLLNGRAATVA